MIPLLAKSTIDPSIVEEGSAVTLLGHLKSVLAAADAVVGTTGPAQLSAVGLKVDDWLERLTRTVRLAAALHDLGKANNHFQDMVRGERFAPQGLRHEWLTFWLCHQSPWREWGPHVTGAETDWRIVLWAVAGHHPAVRRPSPPIKKHDNCSDTSLKVLVSHPSNLACVQWLEKTFGKGLLSDAIPDKDIELQLVGKRDSVFLHLKRCEKDHDSLWRQIRRDPALLRFTAVAKACLLAADVGGSYAGQTAVEPELSPTVPTDGIRVLTEGLVDAPMPEELEEVVRIRLNGNRERTFQREVASSHARVTLVKAGCGSGKTAAAYLWTARCYPGRRLYFCYPTTGTATEGFRDYLYDDAEKLPRLGARLFHSRAPVDAELILHAHENDVETSEDEPWHRADALSAWSTPIVCCTIDRVISLMQNHRKGLMTWPAFAQAAFVFDEIHAYDNRLFGLMLRFLQECRGLPVLLMTASLPEPRRDAILNSLRHVEPSRNDDDLLSEIAGPDDLERLPRYHHEPVDADAVHLRVREEVQSGGRVLWVCNTVKRAMGAADQLRGSGLDPMIYHSRFKYRDRVEQHKHVIDAFSPDCESRPGAVAISTQVAEMSLDLKAATLLVTDLCPVPSLIQRLGRLNRAAQSGDPTRPFCVIEPQTADSRFYDAPYSQKPENYGPWPVQTREWLKVLGGGLLSQRDLADAWQSEATGPAELPADCCWLDGGPRTTVDAVREASFGVTVLLNSDWQLVKSGEGKLAELVLPMPEIPTRLKDQVRDWDRFKGLPVVPDVFVKYCRSRGAEWT